MEGIHENAVQILSDAGFEHVETHATALSEDALIERIRDAHYLGIRSRTHIGAQENISTNHPPTPYPTNLPVTHTSARLIPNVVITLDLHITPTTT